MKTIKPYKQLFIFLTFFLTSIANAENLQIQSSAFTNNELIPDKFTCNGSNLSPELTWKNIPSNTKSLTLIMDDPDAPSGTWTHWVLFNLPPNINSIEENIKTLVPEVSLGKNSWQKNAYGSPCPPSGTHHYIFTLYALDIPFTSDKLFNNTTFFKEMQDHILATATITGIYKRK